jgi:hypothetical protein
MEVSGKLHASTALPQRKNPRPPLNMGLGGPQNRSGYFKADEDLLSLLEIFFAKQAA